MREYSRSDGSRKFFTNFGKRALELRLLVPFAFRSSYKGSREVLRRALDFMSTAFPLPASSRARGRLSIRRAAAWLSACANDSKAGLLLVMVFAAVHALLWTLILVNLK